jgi:hypothetical protein
MDIGALMVFVMLGFCFWVFLFVVLLVLLVGLWRMLRKAGQPGWHALVPLYNIYVLMVRVIGLPVQWFYYVVILYLVSLPQQLSAFEILPFSIDLPELAIVVVIGLSIIGFFVVRLLLRAYGQKDTFGTTIIMLFVPYVLAYRLGFGPATYLGQPSVHDIPRLPWFGRR